MANINQPGINKCTGCGVCAVICPTQSIRIERNENGFYTPIIDDSCIDCGKCLSVCYKYLSDDENRKFNFDSTKVFAAIEKNQAELESVTSGGVANRLAIVSFDRGVDVCGVVFDPLNDTCKHIIVNTRNDLEKIKKSKYLQSYTYDAFSSLDISKRTIIFGTPCQIFGLRKYIQQKKIEENFILVDVFCRGVPSFLLWISYKQYIQRVFGLGEFRLVNFRDKSDGWHKFSLSIFDENKKAYKGLVYKDLFYSFFLKNACFAEPCYDCKLRHEGIYSDIRLGDFWGEKYYSHDEGVSLCVLATKRGVETWESVKTFFDIEECKVEDIFKSQRFNKFPQHPKYHEILSLLRSGEKLEVVNECTGLINENFYSPAK